MSAIFGIFRFDDGEIAPRDIERMGAILAYRGRDGRRYVIDGGIGLGHCLTRVNREDLSEAQPLYDADANLTLVADARLDNREELAVALDLMAPLAEMSDSAIIMAAYQRWGAACAEHLLGDFAFAIWDGRARKLILARDHMGQRYVHYHHGKDVFVFATDIAALWALAEVPRDLSDAQIGRMLLFDLAPRDGRTPFEDVYGVTGGTVMTIGADGTAARHVYWEPHADPAHEGHEEAYYVDAYRRVLGEAVACRIERTLRAPGLIFSGGYDSGAIAGLAGPALAGSGRRLVAASSVMPAGYRGTIRHARRWVEMCARDMPHLDVRYVTREGKSVLTGLESVFLETGLPGGAYHFVTHELLTALAGAGARLIMDGHGGDYTLNPRGHDALAHLLRTFKLRRFVSELRAHLSLSGQSWAAILRRDIIGRLLSPSVIYAWRRLRHGSRPAWGDQPIAQAFAQHLIASGVIEEKTLIGAIRSKNLVREHMTAALRGVAAAPSPGAALSAALRGLELTRPFHDKRVVELALAIPQTLDVKNGRNRYLARVALKDIYPADFQSRGRQNDDEIPDFQRMAKSIEPQLLSDIARMEQSETLSRYVDFQKIRDLLAAREADDHNSGWEQETQLALHGFIVARYVEWLRRDNR